MRKAKAPVQLRQTYKESPGKALFAFFDDSVLTEELGAGAGQ